jgi:hypothetical protein
LTGWRVGACEQYRNDTETRDCSVAEGQNAIATNGFAAAGICGLMQTHQRRGDADYIVLTADSVSPSMPASLAASSGVRSYRAARALGAV